MRNHVIQKITELAHTHSDIMLVCADLGYNVLNCFEEKYPERFINVGIAEQNMSSVAAGLALEGNMVFTYSIGNFPTLRCIEQIRNDICYHKANVKILSVGGGFAYGDLGMSHHATEDLAMMRALPNMHVYAPADELEAVACLEEAMKYQGPAFIRMAKGSEPKQHKETDKLDVTSLIPFAMDDRNENPDITIITTGTVLSEAAKVYAMFQKEGNRIAVYSAPCLKPFPSEKLAQLAQNTSLLVTMEDHNIIGGLGGAVAEIVSSLSNHAPLLRVGLPDTYTSEVGEQDYLRDFYGISATKVYDRIRKQLKEIN